MKVKVTNSGLCPRGVWALGVIKMVGIGASRELTLTDAELEEAKKIEALSFEEIEGSNADDKAELLAKLKALGINANANSKPETLRAKLEEAEAALEKERKEREETIAALNAKQVAFEPDESLEDLKAKLTAAE